MKRGTLRRLDSLATDGVERAESNGPPTAFRIWRAGSNVTDHGPTLFSERSAALLLSEQATRGNRYSIDVDHLSLDKDAPIGNHAAVGWHSLEVRDGELWATNVEWTAAVRAGLTKDPPEWKYFSPAYDVDEAGEVVSYLNTALTNNPATWRVTALASRGASTQKEASRMAKATGMKWGDIKAALDGDDEDAKATAYAAIKAAFPDEEPDGDEGGKKKEEKKDDAADGDPKKDAEEEPAKKDAEEEPAKKDAEGEPEKKDAKASVVAAQDARIRKLEADNAAFQKEREDAERRTLIASREMSADLAKTLAKKPLADVRDICAALPPKAEKRSGTTETVQATRGASLQDARTPRLPADESRALRQRMGLDTRTDSIRWEGTKRVFPVTAAPVAKGGT